MLMDAFDHRMTNIWLATCHARAAGYMDNAGSEDDRLKLWTDLTNLRAALEAAYDAQIHQVELKGLLDVCQDCVVREADVLVRVDFEDLLDAMEPAEGTDAVILTATYRAMFRGIWAPLHTTLDTMYTHSTQTSFSSADPVDATDRIRQSLCSLVNQCLEVEGAFTKPSWETMRDTHLAAVATFT